MVMVVIITLWISASIIFFIGIGSLRKFHELFSLLVKLLFPEKLERMWQINSSETLGIRRNTPETEAELVTETRFEVLPQSLLIENNEKLDVKILSFKILIIIQDLLTLKEIEEYFPKQTFQILKNPFQETT